MREGGRGAPSGGALPAAHGACAGLGGGAKGWRRKCAQLAGSSGGARPAASVAGAARGGRGANAAARLELAEQWDGWGDFLYRAGWIEALAAAKTAAGTAGVRGGGLRIVPASR